MSAIRAGVAEALFHKLDLGPVHLTEMAIRYKEFVMDAMFGKGQERCLRAKLRKLAPGDWLADRFVFPAAPGTT